MNALKHPPDNFEENIKRLVTPPLNVTASHCHTVTININISPDLMDQDRIEQLIVQVIKEQIKPQETKKKENKKKT